MEDSADDVELVIIEDKASDSDARKDSARNESVIQKDDASDNLIMKDSVKNESETDEREVADDNDDAMKDSIKNVFELRKKENSNTNAKKDSTGDSETQANARKAADGDEKKDSLKVGSDANANISQESRKVTLVCLETMPILITLNDSSYHFQHFFSNVFQESIKVTLV